MKLEKIDKQVCQQLRAEIDAALATVAAKYGLSIQLKNIKFSEFEFKAPLEVKIEGKAKDYSEVLSFLNLPPIGTKFRMQGRTFIVSEHKPNTPKYNVIANEEGKGGSYKFTAEAINASLKLYNSTPELSKFIK